MLILISFMRPFHPKTMHIPTHKTAFLFVFIQNRYGYETSYSCCSNHGIVNCRRRTDIYWWRDALLGQ